MGNTILLLEDNVGRRSGLRRALERRGHRISAGPASAAEFVIAAAELNRAPNTVLVGASMDPALVRLVKRTFPAATVLAQDASALPHAAGT